MDTRRTIKGIKDFGGKVAFKSAKLGLKTLAKVPEVAGRLGTKGLHELITSEQGQVILTTSGLVTASILVPQIAIGLGAVAGSKFLANKLLGKGSKSIPKSLTESVKETIMLGNRLTASACKGIAPGLEQANEKIQELGGGVQNKIDELFQGR